MSNLEFPLVEHDVPKMVQINASVHPLRIQSVLRQVEVGRTIQSIVQEVCPLEFRSFLVVTINGEEIQREEWEIRRVRFDEVIVFRAIPQGNAGKFFNTLIQIVVMAVAVIVLTPFIGLPAAFAIGSILGHLIANALIPPSSFSNTGSSATQTFGISGISNQELPYGVVPRVCGRTLITPPKGAHSYTVTQANDTYLYALFDLGPGPVAISNIQIGQTPIDSFSGVTYEVREGRSSDAPLTLYTNTVKQTPLSIELTYAGSPATQRTPLNTSHIEVDITNPGGLFTTDNNGNFVQYTESFAVTVTLVGGGVVATVPVNMSGQSTSSVASTTVVFDGAAGQYDVQIQRGNPGPPDQKKGSAKPFWTALRTWTPNAGPILPQNRAKIAVKIKANEQLNGDIANLNCIAQAYVQVWDGTSFSEQLNTHPAWAAYMVLTSTSNARPLDQSRIDLNALKNWAAQYPSAEFNYVFSSRSTIWQALRTIGSAGRAQPVVRDGVYSFIFDRVQDSPVQLFTSRNVVDFKATKQYLNETQAMEIRYISETMGWQQNSIYTYAAGFNAGNVDANKITPLDLTGVTSDTWAAKLGAYFFAAGVIRNTTYQFTTDLDHLACNPGDRVWVQHDIVTSGVGSGRVNAVTRSGGLVTSIGIDESITGDGLSNYVLRGRASHGTIYSLPISVSTTPGHTLSFVSLYDDSNDPIAVGDLVAVSTVEQGMLDAVVKSISPDSTFKATVTLLDYAPQVHNGDAISYAPLIDNRVNTFLFPQKTASVSITSLASAEADAIISSGGWLIPRIHGTFTVNNDGYAPDYFEIQWQKVGDIGWQAIPPVSSPIHEFYIPISFADKAASYNVRARGNMNSGHDPSIWTNATIQLTSFIVQPQAPTAIAVNATIGGVSAIITPGAGIAPTQYNLYVGTTGFFAAATLVGSSQTGTIVASGLTVGIPYLAWGTTLNGAGVESLPAGPVGFVPLPIGYDSLSQDVTDFLTFQGNAMRDAQDAISALSQTVASLGLGGYTDVQQIRTELHSATGALTADYTNLITVATGPSSSLATSITALQSALTGYTGASAVANAISTLTTSVTVKPNVFVTGTTPTAINVGDIWIDTANANAVKTWNGTSWIVSASGNKTFAQTSTPTATAVGDVWVNTTGGANTMSRWDGTSWVAINNASIAASASSITTLNSQVGNFYSSGLFRVNTSSTPSGADARITLEVAASSGGSPYTAAMFLDAMTGGTSRITMVASQVFMTDGTNNHAPFSFSGGVLNIDNAVIQNLTAGSILTGTLTTATLNTNAATDIVTSSVGYTNVITHTTFNIIAGVTVLQVVNYAPILVTIFGDGIESGAVGSVNMNAWILVDGTPYGIPYNANNVSYNAAVQLVGIPAGSHNIYLACYTEDYSLQFYPYYLKTEYSGSGTWLFQGTIDAVSFKR